MGGLTAVLLAIAGGTLLVAPVRITSPRRIMSTAAAGAAAAVPAAVVVGIPVVTVLAALGGAALPGVRRRAARRRAEQACREAWADAVIVVRSGVRAGWPVAESVARAVERVPPVLRPRFTAVRAGLAVGESFRHAVAPLACDEDGRRFAAVLTLAEELGASDTGQVLDAYAEFLGAEVAQRREVAARHSWNVSAARVALAAPWLTVLALGLQLSVRESYASPAGTVLLSVVAVVTVIAYSIMMAVARAAER